MKKPEKITGGLLLADHWNGIAHSLATMSGALAALTSLLFDHPLHIACLHGGEVWLAVCLIAKGGNWALQYTTVSTPQSAAQLELAERDDAPA